MASTINLRLPKSVCSVLLATTAKTDIPIVVRKAITKIKKARPTARCAIRAHTVNLKAKRFVKTAQQVLHRLLGGRKLALYAKMAPTPLKKSS